MEPPRSRYSAATPSTSDDVGPCRALQRPPVGLVPTRPGQRRAVRVRGVGCGEEMDGSRRHVLGRFSNRPQSIQRAGQRELGCAKTVHEVAAPDPAGLLEGAEDRVDAREPALDAFGRDSLAGQDAVALQQGQRLGVQPFRGGQLVRSLHERTNGPRPPAVPAT